MFLDRKVSKFSESYYRELRFYPSIAGIVEAMNTLFRQFFIAKAVLHLKCREENKRN